MKKRIKRTLAGILCIFILICSIPSAGAEDFIHIAADSASCGNGSEVKMDICIDSNPGIWGIDLEVYFPADTFELKSITNGSIFPNAGLTAPNIQKGSVVISYEDAGFNNVSTNGVLATLVFDVSEKAQSGEYRITLSCQDGDIINADAEELPFSIQNGVVTVVNANEDKPTSIADEDTSNVAVAEESEKNDNATDRSKKSKKTDETADPLAENETRDSAVWENPFIDVSETDPYYKAIEFVYQNRLFIGVSDTEFAPHTTMTRAMFVTVLGRLDQVDTTQFVAPSPFLDVAANAWYTPYVGWAQECGIVKGYSATKFGVNDPVTVEQAVVILARYAGFCGLETNSGKENTVLANYADGAPVSDWAKTSMSWAIANGIYSGETVWLYPQTPAPRRLVAQMIMALAEMLGR